MTDIERKLDLKFERLESRNRRLKKLYKELLINQENILEEIKKLKTPNKFEPAAKKMMNKQQVMSHLGIKNSKFYEWISEGVIPKPEYLGKKSYYDISKLTYKNAKPEEKSVTGYM